MNSDDITAKGYLDQLYRMTEGELDSQISMHDVGSAIGLDRGEAGRIAQELMVQGFVELKTLAGGIAITQEGLNSLGVAVSPSKESGGMLKLGQDINASEQDLETANNLTTMIKDELPELKLEYPALETVVLDLKTLELHLLSQKPRNGVIRELFLSIKDGLKTNTSSKCLSITTLESVI